MNNVQIRSALSVLKYLISAPEKDKQFIIQNLTRQEIKNICRLTSEALSSDINRSASDKNEIRKSQRLITKLAKAKTPTQIKSVKKKIVRVGGGVLSTILLALLGGVVSGVANKLTTKKW